LNLRFRRLFPAAIISLTLAIRVFGQVPSPPKDEWLDKALNTINSMINMGEFERALSYLEHTKTKYGVDHPKLTSMYKKVYSEAKMFSELEDMIQEQIARSPGDPILLAELGNVRFLVNDIRSADSLWELALNTGDRDKGTYIYVAAYKLRYGDYDGAAEVYFRGRNALGSQSVFALELASVYEAKREYPGAVDELLTYLNQSPGRLRIVRTRIRGFMEDTDDPETIIEAVVRGTTRFPQSIETREILGDLFLKNGDMDKALDVYRKLGKGQKDDGNSLCRFAERCLENGSFSAAIEAVDEYLGMSQLKAKRDLALLIKNKGLRSKGLPHEAAAGLNLLSRSSMNLRIAEESVYLLGEIYSLEFNDCDSAIMIWGNLTGKVESNEFRVRAAEGTAACYMKMDRFPSAESLLTVLLKDGVGKHSNQKSVFMLADVAFIKGDYEKAKSLYEQLAKVNPGDHYANNSLERLMVLGSASSLDSLNKNLEMFARGLRELSMGHLAAAAGYFSDSLLTDSPLEQHTIFLAASIYFENGDDPAATSTFQRYVDRFPQGIYIDRVYLGLGELFMKDMEKLPLARSLFNRILEESPDGPVVEQAREQLRMIELLSNKIG
jgi:tetratricopeptide (TPR) repeat protein